MGVYFKEILEDYGGLVMALMTVYHGGYMTEEWFDFIVDCRFGKKHDYDIVIGAMANDQIYNYVSDYIEGAITREQFWVMAKFKYPTHQINFCTKEALQCLKYRGYEVVE